MSGKVWIKALASGRFTRLRGSFISAPQPRGAGWGPETKVIQLWKARGDFSARQEQKASLGTRQPGKKSRGESGDDLISQAMQCNAMLLVVKCEGKGLRSATLSSIPCHPVPFSGPTSTFSGPTYRNQQCDTISFLHPKICHMYVGSFWHFVICFIHVFLFLCICILVFARLTHGNIIFDTLEQSPFQKYATCWVFLALSHMLYLCICVFCICLVFASPYDRRHRPLSINI